MRQAPPEAAAEEQALKTLRDRHRTEYEKAKTPEEKAAFAGRLLSQAGRARKGSPEQFVLWKVARDVAVQAGSADLAVRAVDGMAQHFEVDGLAMKGELLTKLAKTARQPAEKRALVLAALGTIDQAVAQDNYLEAERMAVTASALVRETRDAKLAQHVAARKAEIGELGNAHTWVAKAKGVLEKKPDDPAANLAVGSFVCLWKGDWAAGLPMLAKSGDALLRGLAEQERNVADSAQAQTELADAWWDLGLRSDGIARRQLQLHAAHWYRRAVPNLPEGLVKSRVQKRLAETAALHVSLPSGVKPGVKPGGAGSAGSSPDSGGTQDAGKKRRLARKNRYESMLGVYLAGGKPTPFVSASVPNGSNMLTDEIAAAMRGRINLTQIGYKGIARFEITQEGTYEFDQRFDKVWVNNREMGFGNSKGSVKLPKGLYEIRVEEGGRQLRGALLRIKNKETGEPVPVFNFGGDVEKFLHQTAGPFRVTEVSDWQPVELPAAR